MIASLRVVIVRLAGRGKSRLPAPITKRAHITTPPQAAPVDGMVRVAAWPRDRLIAIVDVNT